jgi:DNA-binding NarL/FixJ family response regulator
LERLRRSFKQSRAIVKAQELRPNIIVLDLSMPQINGLTAGRILKEILPGTRLILFTAFGTLLSTDAPESAGFSALISKSDAGKLLKYSPNFAESLLSFVSAQSGTRLTVLDRWHRRRTHNGQRL